MINQEKLFNDVLWLTSTIASRNFWNPDILDEVADTIMERFQSLDLEVNNQAFEADGEEYRNIIASIGPKDAERIIISAHYDVCGEILGADVNASGIAGLLELARLISQSNLPLTYRIDFAAYCITEAPFFGTELMGSLSHIHQLQTDNAKVHSMLALSGIGYFTDEPDSQEYPIFSFSENHSTVGNFIGVTCLREHSEWFRQVYQSIKASTQVPVELLAYPTNNDNVGISDHRCFLRNGYRAAMIGNGGHHRNPNYHQIPDTIETLDFSKMSELLKGIHQFLLDVQ